MRAIVTFLTAPGNAEKTAFSYHNDHLGGVNIISDFNGNQVQNTEYDPWGKVSRSDGNVDPTHRFTGQELDSESDIHYYGGRYYDQGLGRFISPDPFVQSPDDPQNLNRYSYVLNGPQNYIDPSGYEYADIELINCAAGCSEGGIGSSSAGSVFTTTGWSGSSSFSNLQGFQVSTSGALGGVAFGIGTGSTLPSFDSVLGTASNFAGGVGGWFSGGFMNTGGFSKRAFGQRWVPFTEWANQFGVPGTDAIIDRNSSAYKAGETLAESLTTVVAGGLMVKSVASAGARTVVTPTAMVDIASAYGTPLKNLPLGRMLNYIEENAFFAIPHWVWYGASGFYAMTATGRAAVMKEAVGKFSQFEQMILRLRGIPIDIIDHFKQ